MRLPTSVFDFWAILDRELGKYGGPGRHPLEADYLISPEISIPVAGPFDRQLDDSIMSDRVLHAPFLSAVVTALKAFSIDYRVAIQVEIPNRPLGL